MQISPLPDPQAAPSSDQTAAARRLRQGASGLIWLLLALLLLAGIAWTERQAYRSAEQQVTSAAQRAADQVAALIASRLNNQFTELQFAAVALLGPDAEPRNPAPQVVQTLRRFMALYPNLYAFNIQSADGNQILWSNQPQSSTPITSGAQFTPLPSNPDFLLGQDRYAPRVGAYVITMRYRLRGPDGQVRFFVGSPYRIDDLLRPASQEAARQPWTFVVRDTRDGSVLGVVDHGAVTHPAAPPAARLSEPVPGFPLRVQATWPPQLVAQTYRHAAATRWAVEAAAWVSLLLASLWIARLIAQRNRQLDLMQRMDALQDLLAQVNQAAVSATDTSSFLQSVCDLAITRGRLKLAYVAQPEPDGQFGFVAAAGATGYLDGLVISTDPTRIESQGPVGTAWREHRAVFNHHWDFAAWAAPYLPFVKRAKGYGLLGISALPLHRKGQPFAILALYRGDDLVFSPEMRALLTELAEDVSRDLDHIDNRNALHRLVKFNALRAQILGTDDTPSDIRGYLQRCCDFAVACGLLQLAWVGAPEKDGRFGIWASSGQTTYLQTVPISADPSQPGGNGPSGRAWREQQSVFVNRHQSPGVDDVWSRAGAVAQLGAFAALPLRQDGKVLAVLTLYCKDTDVWDDTTRVIAQELVSAIEQGLQMRHRQLQIDRLQRLYRALMFEGDVLLQARNEADMLNKTCRLLTRHTPFHAVWVGRPDGDRMRAVVQSGPGAQALSEVSISLADDAAAPLVVRAWHAQRLVFNNDHLADPRLAPWKDFLRKHRWHAALAAPVRRGGQLWGVIAFVSPERNVFDEQTVALCKRVAGLLGHGLDELDLRAKLLAQQRAEAHRARHDALTGLPNRFSLESHLPRALERARRHGTAVAVGLLDLDDFKPVNDRLGHDAGDVLLQRIAQQLQSQLRGSDYLARLGGDEFVLVLEDLDPAQAESQLALILKRLERVFHTPIDLGQDRKAQVGPSLGLALFPGDGEDGDTLLRNADAAMYQIKSRKATRSQWWRLWREGTLAAPVVESPFDPFDTEAQRLLQTLTPILHGIAPEFAAGFYAQVSQDPQSAAILHQLSPEEFEHLQKQQALHFEFLLHPQTTAEDIAARAQHIGQVHALVGVPVSALMRAMDGYEGLLRTQIERSAVMASTRYRLLRLAQARLQRHMHSEIAAQQTLLTTYHAALHSIRTSSGRFSDKEPVALAALAALPGIPAVFLFRLNAAGEFRIVDGAGQKAAQILAEFNARQIYPVIHPNAQGQRGPLGKAWVSGTRQVVDAYLHDPRMAPWHEIARRYGVRSAVAIPVLRHQIPEMVLFVLGAYPGQFSHPGLQVWLDGVQHEWQQLLDTATPAQPVLSDLLHREAWRALLYEGALRMVVQPVVDLRSGAVVKVEALARLQDGNTLLSPGQFLPVLGESDLQLLFRQGLAQSLRALRAWRQEGLDIALSLNLDPTTLVAPDCAQWVERALREADLPPAALTLELLETQDLDAHSVEEAVARLHALGVGLGMDDLGSGYSSMKRLASMPFDVIKIDQDVVQDVRVHPLQGIALMRTVLQLGRDMDCAVVAEGLEDAALIEVARLLGCELGQGYGLARPMPIDTFLEWHRTHVPLPLPSMGDLQSWLGAIAYVWLAGHADAGSHAYHTSVAACPLTRFFQQQGVQDAEVLRWHELWHESAFEQERREASAALLQWMEQQAGSAMSAASPAPGS